VPEPLSAAASTDAPVTEKELAALHAEFSRHKNKLIDLQTKRNLAASFASSSPFAVLDNNAQAIGLSPFAAFALVRCLCVMP
jgi:hypothetical protein